nr:Glutamate racemase [Chlamydiota bacterium]
KGRIALLGTEATIRSGVYEAVDTSAEIIPLAMQELINAIEAKQVPPDLLMNSLARVRATGADTVILACTHFAHIEKEIQASLGDKVHLINPAHAVANDLREKLGPMPDARSTQKFFTSGIPFKATLPSRKIHVQFFSQND